LLFSFWFYLGVLSSLSIIILPHLPVFVNHFFAQIYKIVFVQVAQNGKIMVLRDAKRFFWFFAGGVLFSKFASPGRRRSGKKKRWLTPAAFQ
jgi:hypothetical protein